MNWGYKLLVFFLSFVFAMLAMVFTAILQTNEMEDEQYYVKELKYQELIDGKKNINKLGTKPLYTKTEQGLTIKFPKEDSKPIEQGKIRLLRPDSQKLDVLLPVSVDTDGLMFIEKTKLVKGIYKAQLEWTSQGVFYYDEQELYID